MRPGIPAIHQVRNCFVSVNQKCGMMVLDSPFRRWCQQQILGVSYCMLEYERDLLWHEFKFCFRYEVMGLPWIDEWRAFWALDVDSTSKKFRRTISYNRQWSTSQRPCGKKSNTAGENCLASRERKAFRKEGFQSWITEPRHCQHIFKRTVRQSHK